MIVINWPQYPNDVSKHNLKIDLCLFSVLSKKIRIIFRGN